MKKIVDAVWRLVSRYDDGEIWLDTLKAQARVRKLLATSIQEDGEVKWRVALRMFQKTHDDLVSLRQRVEDTILVAQTDVDAEESITAYHFKTGAIHRLLAEARKGYGTVTPDEELVYATPVPVAPVDAAPSRNERAVEIVEAWEANNGLILLCDHKSDLAHRIATAISAAPDAEGMRRACVEKLRESLKDTTFGSPEIKAALTDWSNYMIRLLEAIPATAAEKENDG